MEFFDAKMTRRALAQIGVAAAAAAPGPAATAPDICFLSAVEMPGLIRRKK